MTSACIEQYAPPHRRPSLSRPPLAIFPKKPQKNPALLILLFCWIFAAVEEVINASSIQVGFLNKTRGSVRCDTTLQRIYVKIVDKRAGLTLRSRVVSVSNRNAREELLYECLFFDEFFDHLVYNASVRFFFLGKEIYTCKRSELELRQSVGSRYSHGVWGKSNTTWTVYYLYNTSGVCSYDNNDILCLFVIHVLMRLLYLAPLLSSI